MDTPLIADPEMEETYYGVTFACLGEDGDRYLALGHHSPRRMLDAVNRYARVVCGLRNFVDDPSADAAEWLGRVEHKHAIFRAPDPARGEDPECPWWADWSNPDAPGARPVTLLEVS